MQNPVPPMVRTSLASCCLALFVTIGANAAPQTQPPIPGNAQTPTHQAHVVAVNRHSFEIPFSLKSNPDQIVEVLLFQSTDRGRTWQLHSRQNPNASKFPYTCESDGQYWFAVRSQSRDGVMIPGGQLFPELKLTVDTKKPELEFDVRPDAAGRVVGAWRADDANLDPNSLKIQYQSSPTGAWKDVPKSNSESAASTYQNQLAWWPESAGRQLLVRAEIKDKAGNATVVDRQITIPQVANLPHVKANQDGQAQQKLQAVGNTSTAQNPSRQPSAPARFASNSEQFFPGTQQNTQRHGQVTNEPPPPPQESVKPMTPLPVPLQRANNGNSNQPGQVWESQVTSQPNQNQVVSGSTSNSVWRSRESSGGEREFDGMVVTEGSTLSKSTDGFSRPVQASNNTASFNGGSQKKPNGTATNAKFASSPSPTENTNASNGQSARPINSKMFSLDYEIDAVGPSGVKDVVLWGTTDGGRSWKSWTTDDDQQSPFKVEVPQDGVYGFRIVISSNDGLRGRSPRPGEQADVWLHVDTKAPQAKIISAPYGEVTEVGKLVINWQVHDEDLALRPIDLAFSRRPNGPWTKISNGLRNESRFVWKPELQTPDLVYIKLDARDKSGNVSTDITTRPIDISGLKPRGHIRDVRPIRAKN